MVCPKCGYPQYCPCPSCADSLPSGFNPWVWIDGEYIKCVGCGITKHADWWLDREIEQIDIENLVNKYFRWE